SPPGTRYHHRTPPGDDRSIPPAQPSRQRKAPMPAPSASLRSYPVSRVQSLRRSMPPCKLVMGMAKKDASLDDDAATRVGERRPSGISANLHVLVLSGTQKGKSVPLTEKLTIGKADDN